MPTRRALRVAGSRQRAGLDGEYLVDEEMPDGSILIRPSTGAAAMRRRLGVEQLIAEELRRIVADSGIAPPDGEG